MNDEHGSVVLEKPYYGTKTLEVKKTEPFSVISKNKCSGCSACYNICPFSAITMEADNEGFVYPKIDDDKCTNCGLCEKVCPVLNPPAKILQDRKPLGVYAAYSKDEEIRVMSTTAGAFSEFARYAFSKDGVVYGAAYDSDFKVNHVRIESISDLPKIRQSKYYQSNINETFRQIKADLNDKKFVMFCGAPCQTGGLYSYLGKLAESDKLFILDFICHSICSPLAFKEYLKELEDNYKSKAVKVQFKNKDSGWHHFGTRIEFENGQVYNKFQGVDDYMQSFLRFRSILRPSCHDCSFKGTRRVADVTLADFWGLQNWPNAKNPDDQSKGVSLIIINSDRGNKVFRKYVSKNMYCETRTLEEALPRNGGYANSNRVGLYRDFIIGNLGKAPFSQIIKAAGDNEKKLEAQRKKQVGVPAAGDTPQITGKLTKFGNVILDMKPGSRIIIDEGGELILNAKLPKGSAQETTITMYPNTVLHIKGKVSVGYGATWIIWAGSMTIGGANINKFSYVTVKNNPVIGKDFLCGTHLYLLDDDFHQIIDNSTGQVINKTKSSVVLGDHIWFGNNVTIVKNVTVGNGAIVGTHSIVTKPIPEKCLAVGSPAKVIKEDISWKG